MTDLGTVTICYSLSFERRSPHPAERVWAAITDPDEIARWMEYPARVDLRPGGEYDVDFRRTGEGELTGVIIRAVPGRELAFAWGRSVVEWTITPKGEECDYRFVHHGVDGEEGLFAGWHAFLDQLDSYLDGVALDPSGQHAAWESLQEPYRSALDRLVTKARVGSTHARGCP